MNAESVIQTFNLYRGSGVIPVLFFVALLYIYWSRGKKEKKDLIRIVLLSLLLVFNDGFFYFCKKAGMGLEYYRFFWMIPIIPVMACVFVEILGKTAQKWEKIVGGAAVLLLLLSCDSSYLNIKDWGLPENKYGISQDALQIATILENIKEKERPVVAFDYKLNLEVRQYDASVICALSRDEYLTLSSTDYVAESDEYEEAAGLMRMLNKGVHEDKTWMASLLDERDVDYIVVSSDFGLERYLGKLGCKEIGQSDHYTLYNVHEKKE